MSKKRLPLSLLILSVMLPCVAFSQYRINNASVWVNQANAISTSITTSSAQVCKGSTAPTVTLTASGGTAPYTFYISINGVAQSPITNITSSTTLTVNTLNVGTLTYRIDSVASNLEKAEVQIDKSIEVTIQDLPDASFTFTNDNQCAGTNIVFTPAITPLSSYTFSWNFGDGTTSTSASPTHNFYSAGNGTENFAVKLTVTNKTIGCVSSTTQTVKVIQGADVNMTSDATLKDYNGYKTFIKCQNTNQSFIFYNSSTTNNTSFSIDWGDGSTIWTGNSWTTLSHTYSPGLWSLKYSVLSSNGCNTTITYKVFVGSNPSVSLGNPGNTDVCSTMALTFPITGTENNPPGTTYTVSFNDGSSPTVLSHPAPATVTHTFLKSSCGITSSNGTTSFSNSFSASIVAENPCGMSAVAVVPIYVSTAPEAKFSIANSTGCINQQIQLINQTNLHTESSSSGCSSSKVIWTITPSTGFSLNSGSQLGNDLGNTIVNSWTSGSTNLYLTFNTAGQYIVKMKVGNNCGISEKTDTICIVPTPVPAFSIDNTTGCAPLTINTNNTTDETNLCNDKMTYLWQIGYTPSNCGTSQSYTITTPGGTTNNGSSTLKNTTIKFNNPGTYTLKLTASNSCGSVVSATQTIVVKAPPTVTISDLNAICQNASGTVVNPSATITNCGTSALTYEWSFPDGTPATSTSGNPGSITYNSFGEKTITLKVSNECSSVTTTKKFTIHPLPTVNDIPNQTKCAGTTSDAITFSGTNATAYNWTNSNTAIGLGASGTGNIPAFTVKNTGNTMQTATITVTPVSANCTGTAKTFTISVKPALKASTSENISLCKSNSSYDISFTGQNGTPPYTFTYQLNNGASQTISSPAGSDIAKIAVDLNNAGTYTYKLISISDASTLSCTQSIDASTTVTVLDVPNIVKNYVQTICNNTSTTITPASDSENSVPPGTSYIWSTPTVVPVGAITGAVAQTTPVNTLTFPALLNTTSSPATVTYTVTPAAGSCNGNTFTVQLTVQPSPVIAFSQGDQQICSGNTTNEVTLSTTTPGAVSFSWTATAPTGVTGVATSGTDKIPVQTLINSTNTPQIITYKAKAKMNDSGGCDGTEFTYRITVLPTPSVTSVHTAQYCNNESVSGIVFASNVSGTTYKWTNDNTFVGIGASGNGNIPAFTATNTGLTDIVANIKVIPSANGCDGTESSFTITVHPSPTIDQPTDQIVCNGYATSEVVFTGDISGTSYEWSHNKPGIGLATSGTGNIPAFNAINTGSVPVVATFTVTPKIGSCSGNSKTFSITINPSPVITNQPASESLCVNGTPKLLSVTFTNSVSTPTYQWYENSVKDLSTGTLISGQTQSTYQPSGAVSGIKYYYCVLTFPSGGCTTLSTEIATITVNELPAISENPAITQQICVGGAISPLTVKYNGGSGTPQYQWYENSANTNSGGTAISGATMPTYTPPAFTSTGSYYFYVALNFTDGGCGSIKSQPAEIIVVPDPVVSSQPLSDQMVCQGSTPVSLDLTATGGIGTYSYQWYELTLTGSNIIDGATQSSYLPSTDVVGVRKYFCTITQTGTGCNVNSATCTVTVNKSPVITQQPQSATYCKNETAQSLKIAYSDGVGTPQYQWYETTQSNATGGIAIPEATTDTYSPSTDSASVRYYYCIITLPNGGCNSLTSNVAKITVYQYPVVSDYECEIGSGTGFTVQPTTGHFNDIIPTGTSYTWSEPVIVPAGALTGYSVQSSPQTEISQTLTNTTKSVAIATYSVLPIVNGCYGQEFKVIVRVNPPINITSTVNDISCFGANDGSIAINIEGGRPPYVISWIGADNFTSDQSSISDLKPGNYTLKVTDNGGLPFTTTYTVKEPELFKIAQTNKNDVSCHGAANGSIDIIISGGNEPYTFNWTKDGAAYSSHQNISGLSPGEYTVTVDDKNHCGPVTQSFTIIEPDALNVQLSNVVNNICAGDKNGSISVTVSGGTLINTNGTLDYNYQWTGPKGFTANTKDIVELYSGTYQLQVTDAMGCNVQFTAQVTEPDSIGVQITTTPITCYGADDASIKLDVSGGIAPYTAEWDNLATGFYQQNLSAKDYMITITDANNCTKVVKVTIPEAPVFRISPVVKPITCHGAKDASIKLNIEGGQGKLKLIWSDNSTSGNERNNLGPGTYSVTISDEKPCTITRTFIIQEPLELNVTGTITDALNCSVVNSGSIDLQITGGTEPYSIFWSNGASTKDLKNIAPGNYSVQITDAHGCIKQEQFTVSRPAPIAITIDKSYLFDCSSQKISQKCIARVSGGVPPYQINWSSGEVDPQNNLVMQTTQDATAILSVTDAIGCEKSVSFTTEIPYIGISYEVLDCNSHSYQFNLDYPDFLFTNVRYQWNFGDGSVSAIRHPQHTYISPGIYDVKVAMQSNECNTTFTYRFYVDSIPVLKLNKPVKLCKNDSVIIHISGADFYNWSDGTTGDSIIIRTAGEYSVIGTTKYGCNSSLSFSASYYDNFNYVIESDKDQIVPEDATVNFWSLDVPFTDYYWNFGDGKDDYGNHISHDFNVNRGGYIEVELTATNPFGCKEKATKKIWLSMNTMPNIFTPNGDGYNDVFLKGWNLQVFNSNGVLLYQGLDGWDGTYKGTPVTTDTYYYVVVIYSVNGSTSKSGFVTVVR